MKEVSLIHPLIVKEFCSTDCISSGARRDVPSRVLFCVISYTFWQLRDSVTQTVQVAIAAASRVDLKSFLSRVLRPQTAAGMHTNAITVY